MTEAGQGMANGYRGTMYSHRIKALWISIGLLPESKGLASKMMYIIEEERTMIKLTKFNSDGKKGEFILNAEIIETMEETPDTVITLTNGKKLIVQDRMEDIVRKVMVYKRALYK